MNQIASGFGDMRRGQSLVVWVIRKDRLCEQAIDRFLMGRTEFGAAIG